ncbi:MAG: hypothetical protein H6709_02020 [Kofleriaceae bacterium]|nr:hypothetical protein [Kofleriaceae bacterium]
MAHPPASLRRLGYWIREPGDDSFVPPQELVGRDGEVDYDRIADYLCAAPVFEAYRGYSWCRFGCDLHNGHREHYDGAWLWPEGLAHYVRAHRVRLPAEFEARATSHHPLSVAPPDAYEIDEGFWVAWCAERRTGALRDVLAAAAERDAAARAERHQARIRRMEQTTGLSETGCQWAGCQRLALRGKPLCAACALRGQEPDGRGVGTSLLALLNG